MNHQLTQITRLIQARRYDEARPLLQAYLDDNPDDAYAWYLHSFAELTPVKRLKAIQRAVKFAPTEAKYQNRLEKLTAKAPSRLPLFLGAGLLMAAVIAIAAVMLTQQEPAAVSALPTAADLASITPSPIPPTATATATVTATVTHLSPTPSETFTPTATPSATITETQPPTSLPPTPEVTVEAAAVQAAGTLPAGVVPIPTALDGSISVSPVAGEAPPGAAPTDAAPATLVPGSTVPLGSAVSINGGSLRVLSAMRPASKFITDMGGSPSAPPSGQERMLVELLLICSGGDNCTPTTSSFQLVNPTGGAFTTTAVDLGALFSPNGYSVGQTWGYLSFLVPRSEMQLTLVLNAGGQEVRFALA